METTRTPERENRFKWVGLILIVKRIVYGLDSYDKPYLAFSKDVSDARIRRWRDALETAKRDGTVAHIYQGVYSPRTIREICRTGDSLEHYAVLLRPSSLRKAN